MNVAGGGFIMIINYPSDAAATSIEDKAILSENNLDLLTESGSPILIET